MPTKRVKRQPERIGISAEAIAAWREGDYHKLNRELQIGPHQWSPFDASEAKPPQWMPDYQLAFWERARQLREELLKHGKPGRMDRHGRPLGPAA
jgi:hypothetical protein